MTEGRRRRLSRKTTSSSCDRIWEARWGVFGRGQRCPLCRSDIALPQLARLEARVERMEASMAELLSVMARMPNDMLSPLLDAMVRAASDLPE